MQYIVDFYDELPHWMVFVHAHNSSEHMPDKVSVLQVTLSAALAPRALPVAWCSLDRLLCMIRCLRQAV